ncbi:MAG: phage portal protein [Proteobacteria bacterium]|nr:phage portal protein [Pseudomonadota bacterium]
MAPNDYQSIQSWYQMIMNMMYMGIGYMISDQLYKQWLVENYQLNYAQMTTWQEQGMLSEQQFHEYVRLSYVISCYNEHVYQPAQQSGPQPNEVFKKPNPPHTYPKC